MNEQAESRLLGAILKDNSILEDLTLLPSHFIELGNQNLYKAMQSAYKKGYPIDAASLREELGEAGYMFIGGEGKIKHLRDSATVIHAYKAYELMIINQWKLSATRDLLHNTLDNLQLESIQTLIQELNQLEETGTQEEFNLKNHLKNMYDLVTIETPKEQSGIVSGFMDIDKKTDGFQENDLIIIGARPSIGKTAFLLNMAINAAKKSNAIPIIFSLEMTAESLIRRMLSCLAGINGMKLKNPYHYTDDGEKERWIKEIGTIEKLGLKIYDKPRQTVTEMKAKVRKVKHENPGKKVIVFVDYLTLIKPSKDHNGNTHAQVTEISADLKAMAKDFKCPVNVLAQLSRGVEQRQDKRPFMSDLRESGSIEQDADVIMLLYRDEYYNETTEENRNTLEVDIAKNRDGETGKVILRYIKEINKIENLYHYHSQKQRA